jgi:gamma-glutamyltranspeptidase/glutathione hydrolase
MGDWRKRSGAPFATEKISAVGSLGMVVTNNPLGSAAGAEMIAGGGNAIDGAIASLFALTVVEPMMVGIFGAGMSTVRLASGEHQFINNYTTAPAAATATMYRPVSDTWPDYQVVEGRENDIGVLATGVPGTLRGWQETLSAWGTLSLEEVMQPAIRYAEKGFRATGYLSEIINKSADDIARFPETARTWLPGGSPLKPGELVVQHDYADTLKTIAAEGVGALYGGAIGQAAVDYIQKEGGILTIEDLSGYATTHANVVRGRYRGYDIVGPPPPTAGGVHVIEMLNILEGFDVAGLGFGTADGLHLLARQYMGDPAFVDVPVDMLISHAHADTWRERIDMQRARKVQTAYVAESPATTHMAAADAAGNMISATHTIHAVFGCKATVPGTGVILNNTMNIFDPHPGMANSIAPGKRVTSSMSPIIVEKAGRPVFCVGLVGGIRIFPSALQAIVNVIDHDMTPQEAVEAPRIWTLGEELEVEPGFSDAVLSELDRADGTPIGIGGGMARAGIRFSV